MIEVDSKNLISRLYNVGFQVTEPEICGTNFLQKRPKRGVFYIFIKVVHQQLT